MRQQCPRQVLTAALVLAFCWLHTSTAQQIPEAAGNATCPGGVQGCYTVKDYWPIKTCKLECAQEVCSRGWGAWQSDEICCSPGVAFPEGCGKRPTQCWVVESYQMRSCMRDDRKCLQGYGIWPTQASCCAPSAAFPTGCRTDIPVSPTPCFVVDTYYPARLCRATTTLCTQGCTRASRAEAGVQSWATNEACCAPGAAFSEGCSASGPMVPCWVIDSYYPLRRCRQETDIAACSRGWGVYKTEDVCCSPNVAFPEGCSPKEIPASAQNDTTSAPAVRAAINSQAAQVAQDTEMQLIAPPVPGSVPLNVTQLGR